MLSVVCVSSSFDAVAMRLRKKQWVAKIRKVIGEGGLRQVDTHDFRCTLPTCHHAEGGCHFRKAVKAIGHLCDVMMLPCLACGALDDVWKQFHSNKQDRQAALALREALKGHFAASTKPHHAAVLNGCCEFAIKMFAN